MTEEVLVSVKGFHAVEGMNEEDAIEVFSVGKYYLKNGKHYVFYEERVDDSPQKIKNRIVLEDKYLEVQKTGAINAVLTFEKGVKHENTYNTPYGPMISTVNTKKMSVDSSENMIWIKIDYQLDLNYEHAADSHIEIKIMAKKAGVLNL